MTNKRTAPERQYSADLPKGRNWYQERLPVVGEEHPVDIAVERELRRSAIYRALHKSILELKDALSEHLRPHNKLSVWLTLEAAMNDRSAQRERLYFNRGYEAGLEAGFAHRVLHDGQIGREGEERPSLSPLTAIRALVTSLSAVVINLPESGGGRL